MQDLLIQTILWATDFTSNSLIAGKYAELLASKFKADMLVLHCIEAIQSLAKRATSNGTNGAPNENPENHMFAIADRLRSKGMCFGTFVVKGNPVTNIAQFVAASFAPLVIIGVQGQGQNGHRRLGSVTEEILGASTFPILTVGSSVQRRPGPAPEITRILCAADLSDTGLAAIRYAAACAGHLSAQLDILTIVRPTSAHIIEEFDSQTKHFFERFQKHLPDNARQFCRSASVLDIGNAHDQILHYADEHEADLIVLGIDRASRAVSRSKTAEVSRVVVDALCPVLTVPTEAPDPEYRSLFSETNTRV